MKFLVSILLLSTIIGATMAHWNFEIHGTINCPMYYWCFQLDYIDDFDYSPYGIIASTPWKCFSGPQQKIVHRVDLGDSINGEYDVTVRVRHNCRADGKDMRLSYDLPRDSFTETTINYTLNLLQQ